MLTPAVAYEQDFHFVVVKSRSGECLLDIREQVIQLFDSAG